MQTVILPSGHRAHPWRAVWSSALLLLIGGALPAQEITTGMPRCPLCAERVAGNAPGDFADTLVSRDASYRAVTFPDYVTNVVGPRSLLESVGFAALAQATDRATEWPKTWRGYGDRLSTRLGEVALAQSIRLGLFAALRERSVDATRCQCIGVRARLAHAALTPVRVDTPRGARLSMLGPVSEIGGSLLITTLRPDGFSWREGLRGGVISVAMSPLLPLAREFWPWRWRPPGLR